MDKILTVAQTVVPIFAAIFLGALARRRQLITPEGNRGLQQFVVKFGLPCVVFTSCLTADIGMESLSSMALVLPLMLLSTLLAFFVLRKRFPYHNLPMLFCAQETGMLGIPLFIVLFGADQAYRVGVLDLTQALTAYPVIAILSADTDKNPSVKDIVKNVVTSPLVIMSVTALVLNMTGAAAWLNSVGIGGIISGTTSFIAQPVSAAILFSVGYNFSLAGESRGDILRISGLHFALMMVFCLIMEGILLLIPGTDALTRWAMLMYCILPASFLAPGLGKSKADFTMASGVCSVLTVVCLVIFCVIAVVLA